MIIASAEVLGAVNQGWITPREQLRRLIIPQLEEQGVGLGLLSRERVESAVHFILNRSRGSLAGSEPEGPPSLFTLCVDSFISSPLLSSLTNWYIAIDRIGALEDKIPPLPENIHQILEGACPIYGDQLTVGETHSLYLMPAGTLNEFVQRVTTYGETFFQDRHPLKFNYFWDQARDEHANVPYSEPQWVLITNEILPASRNQPYAKQVQVVEALSRMSLTDYQVPTMRQAVKGTLLSKVATGEGLYPGRNNLMGDFLVTSTHVQETTGDELLIVGGFNCNGMDVSEDFELVAQSVGVAAVRKLSNQSGSI